MIIQDGQAVVNGEHIPWVESVLASSPLLSAVPLIQLLQDALGGILRRGTGTGESAVEAREISGHDDGQVKGWIDANSVAPRPGSDMLSVGEDSDVAKAAKLYQELVSNMLV